MKLLWSGAVVAVLAAAVWRGDLLWNGGRSVNIHRDIGRYVHTSHPWIDLVENFSATVNHQTV